VSTRRNKYLLVKGVAGLGNRILSALSGILFARLSRRTLIIDWSDPAYSGDGANVLSRFFDCRSCVPTDDIPVSDSVRPAIWRGHLGDSVCQMQALNGIDLGRTVRELSVDLSRLDDSEDVLVMVVYRNKLKTLRPHFPTRMPEFVGASDEFILAKLLREELILRAEIRERLERFKREQFGSPTIGVHVRYSDYRVRFVSIISRLNALLKREPGARIFLATDNVEMKVLFESVYGDAVTTTSHWYGEPGIAIHRASNRPDPAERGIEALADLYLLAECDQLILDTTSSFSYLAAVLSKATAPNIIRVAQGAKGDRDKRRRVTKMMRRIGAFSWGLRILPKIVPLRRL
jgi:hypothetical protein